MRCIVALEELAFSYEEDRHLYRNAAGLIRTGVTSSLSAQGIFDFSRVKPAVLENARRRGKNAHKWCAEFDLYGFCDETWIAEDEMPYYQAWQKFVADIKPIVLEVERPKLGLIGGIEVGGTPDLKALIRNRTWIIDRKCCAAKHPGWALQTADYEMLDTGATHLGQLGRMSVQLLPTAKYSLTVYEDPQDAAAAIAAVVLTEWDSQANHYDADHARDILNAWKHNARIPLAA